MKRGYATSRKQEEAVLAAGVREQAIYGVGALDAAIASLRRGDLLVVAGLNALASNRREIRAIVDRVQARDAEVLDALTGIRTDERGVALLDDALGRIHGERVMPDAKRAKAMQVASVKARTKGRMPKREALMIWRDASLTIPEAVALMGKGWSQGTAYREFKKRDVPTGRRGKKS